MSHTLHITTYNIHKGFSHFNRRMVLHELRQQLRALKADVVFLQEVHGNHAGHAARFRDWPLTSQYEFLADSVWSDFAYGKNAVYDHGDHGNAILSRFPIMRWENQNISAHRFEHRGLLHCEIDVPGWPHRLHCVNVHLALFGGSRARQLRTLRYRIQHLVPDNEPVIVAGDFNDWRRRAGDILAEELGLTEVFEHAHGQTARSFPSMFPLFHLDRIYVRGFRIEHARVLHGFPWGLMSDHAALSAVMTRSG